MKTNRLILAVAIAVPAVAAVLLLRNAARPADEPRAANSQARQAATIPAPATAAVTVGQAAGTRPAGKAEPAALEADPAEFRRWVNDHRDALAQAGARPLPPDVLAQGRQLAEARKPAMLRLMRESPWRALDQSLKWHEWVALPKEIQALVETPFSAQADFSVVPDCRPVEARQTPWQVHRLALDGQYFDAFIYGRREQLLTKFGIPLQGIRLENQVALWENPLYPLDGTELAAAQGIFPDGNPRDRSYATGAVLPGEPRAALLGGRIFYFASQEEQHSVASVIARGETTRGPHVARVAMFQMNGDVPVFDPAEFEGRWLPASTWTETPKNVLAMRLDYTPNVGTPYTNQAELQANMLSCSNTIREMSFGKTWIVATVPPQVFSLPRPKAYYETNAGGADELMANALALAHAAGFNTNNFDIYVAAMPLLSRYADAAAFAQVGGKYHWINGNYFAGVTTHEFGHNYGVVHANYWRTQTGAGYLGRTRSDGQSGEHEEYGDLFDIMGDAYNVYPGGHFSMHSKAYLAWIESAEVLNATNSGVYRIHRFDHIDARLTPGRKLALKVTATTGEELWVGYRRALPSFPALASGAYVVWGNTPNEHRLLDTTPLSAPNGLVGADKGDAPVPLCQSYTDPSGTVRITTLGYGGVAPGEYLDVEVTLLPEATPYALYTTSNRTVRGLTGSYVNSSLRSRPAQEDWRSTAGVSISGTRVDPEIRFTSNGWGARASVGVTGGSDADWENFSVQWDGWLSVARPIRLATRTDDGSRMWIDVDSNGVFNATRPEFVNNNWGNGQGPTVGEFSAVVLPGLYRIRIQYEEGVGGNVCELLGGAFEFDLFADAGLTTNGLTGSYVNTSLRSYAPQDDWRTTQIITGRRLDNYPLFLANGWGSRGPVGLTGGMDNDWENFSTQWDGWLRTYTPLRVASLSDDGSRMWVDFNSDANFAATAPEYINNHWGTGQGDTFGDVSATIPAGTYRVRLQYEEGVGGNHFACYGAPSLAPGLSGYALCFDGVDDYVVFNRPVQDDFTIEFWMRSTQVAGAETFWWQGMGLVDGELAGAVNDFGVSLGNGKVLFGDGNGIQDFTIRSGVVADGSWHHVAATRVRSSGAMALYIDGALVASGTGSTTTLNSAAQVRLGSLQTAINFYQGALDEIRIWNYARTSEQIAGSARCLGRSGIPGLVAAWHADEGNGTTAADYTGNGRTGALNGGTKWVISTAPLIDVVTNVVTTLAAAGTGSLSNAIMLANGALCPAVITFSVNGTIAPASPLPVISSSVTLLGPGTNNLTLSGSDVRELLVLASGTTNRVSGLRLANGFSGNHGAAIRNYGRTVLESCWLGSNVTLQSFGGAVCNFPGGSLFATNCVFVRNIMKGGDGESRPEGSTSGGGGGGGAGMGGAIYSDGPELALHGCSFLGNTAAGGTGGNGGGNGADLRGGHGGYPNRGDGGAQGINGNPGGFGGGGGGGGGNSGVPFGSGGPGGFGGGGGGGGASRFGGNGGSGGVAGLYGGVGGATCCSFAGGGGGGAGLGGAIFTSTGAVTIVNCSFAGNVATNGVGGYGSFGNGIGANGQGVGGAIFNLDAKLTTANLTFSGNDATSSDDDVSASTVVTTLADSGPGSLRQAICNAGARPGPDVVTFAAGLSGGVIRLTSDSLIVTNHDGDLIVSGGSLPGGITVSGEGARNIFLVMPGESLTLDSLTLSNGQAVGRFAYAPLGGGLWNFAGTAAVRRCTFVNNRATFGGALMCYQGRLTAELCTFSGNQAATGGGALETGAGTPLVTLSHCTVVSNISSAGGGIRFNNGTVTMRHCLVAANTASTGPNINLATATYAAAAFNLLGDGTTSGVADGVNGNLVGTTATPINARLGALRANGGPTLTHAPLGGSPAIDAGDPLFDSYPGVTLTDQRGYPRVANSRVDIGAVENCLFLFYAFDNFSLQDLAGASSLTHQGSGNSQFNSDHRGQTVSAIALNDPGFGSNNYYHVTTAHDPTNSNRGLGLQDDFTVSAWVFVRQSNAWNIVLGNTGAGVAGTLHLGLANMRPYFGLWGNDLSSLAQAPLNQWIHMAWTYDSHGGQMAMYLNGALVASAIGRSNTTQDADVLIGLCEPIADSYFRGFIDELAIFGKALAPSQIAALAGPAGGLLPSAILPAAQLSPSLPLASCQWNVREIHGHTNDPALLPIDLASALHVANTPQFGRVTNYSSTVINRVDPDLPPCCPGPFIGSATRFAGDTPGDTDYFVLAARTTLLIAAEDDYTFGFASDDGARLRILGAAFASSTGISAGNVAVPAHRGDTLVWPGPTANSTTLGVTHLRPGSYAVEFLAYEITGGAFVQVFAARGVKTAIDGSFQLLAPSLFLPAAQLAITRMSPTQITVSWAPHQSCQRLQSAPAVPGPWTDVPGFVNGDTLTLTPGAQFFRVVQ